MTTLRLERLETAPVSNFDCEKRITALSTLLSNLNPWLFLSSRHCDEVSARRAEELATLRRHEVRR